MKPRRRAIVFGGLALGLALLLLLFLLGGPLGRVFTVPNAGMAPTVARGDAVYMEGIGLHVKGLARGDVVCFRGENLPTLVHRHDWQIKRIVGLPGEKISIRDGKLYVGEKPAPELAQFNYEIFMYDNYLTNEDPSYTVPKGAYFVLGDNPHGSYDSRFFGAVPAGNIAGDAVFRCWPPSRIGAVK
jgi:signal peptidase I